MVSKVQILRWDVIVKFMILTIHGVKSYELAYYSILLLTHVDIGQLDYLIKFSDTFSIIQFLLCVIFIYEPLRYYKLLICS